MGSNGALSSEATIVPAIMNVPSNREETLFEQALGIDTPEARNALLREACGDDLAMLARLQGLLGAHDRAGKFLEHREPDPGARLASAAASPEAHGAAAGLAPAA